MKDFIHHLFIPRASNNYRAKVLHATNLLLVITLLVLGQFFLSFAKTNYSDVLGTATNISVEELLVLTNQKRKEAGLAPVVLNDTLSLAAGHKAAYMFAKNYWAHNAPDGTTPWFFIKGVGYNYVYAGENLARGFPNSSEVVAAWMASPTHRENILSQNYKDIGFAIVNGKLSGEETTLVVEMFGNTDGTIAKAPEQNKKETVSVPSEEQGTQNIARRLSASISKNPVIDSSWLSRNISIVVLGFFLGALLVDMVVIKRKKIVRLAGHASDHTLYLVVILLILMLVGKGSIL